MVFYGLQLSLGSVKLLPGLFRLRQQHMNLCWLSMLSQVLDQKSCHRSIARLASSSLDLGGYWHGC